MPSVVVIGGGLSGAATAYTLARAGLQDITVLEQSERLGGLAGSFERNGSFYPLGYHHILHRDRTLLFFLEHIGALDAVRWRRIGMLFRVDERMFDLGSPAGFLRFPMGSLDKLRFVRLMLRAYRKSDWQDWSDRSAADLIEAWGSEGVRQALFEPLTRIRFDLPCEQVSAAWLGSRLHYREGSAPLGFIPGANWTKLLCDGLARLLQGTGVRVRLRASVRELVPRAERIAEAVLSDGQRVEADTFVSTIPSEVYLKLVPYERTPDLDRLRYTALLSAVCATRQPIQPDFYWLSLFSPELTACGIFLLSSLNPSIGAPGETCVNFVTHLADRQRPLFGEADEEIWHRFAEDFRSIFGARLRPSWRHLSRVPFYSPVFTPAHRNPPLRSTTWRNLYFAGNYRTFPSVVSTGTALGSGVETAQTMLERHRLTSDLPAAISRFRLRSMPRG